MLYGNYLTSSYAWIYIALTLPSYCQQRIRFRTSPQKKPVSPSTLPLDHRPFLAILFRRYDPKRDENKNMKIVFGDSSMRRKMKTWKQKHS